MFERLNYFRFYLALCVLAFHVHRDLVPMAGILAVLAFFFVSGFLVSKMLSETYVGRHRSFLTNRFLRLFPAYWASFLIGLCLILVIPEELKSVNKALQLPDQFDHWVSNIFIFGLQGLKSRVVPPAWSLDVELNWYVIFFILSFFALKYRVLFLCFVCVAFFLFVFPYRVPFYGDVLGSGFAFSLGALHYYIKPKISRGLVVSSSVIIPPYMFLLPHLPIISDAAQGALAHWLVPFIFVAVLFLSFGFFLKPHSVEGERKGLARFSDLFGALSYPVFLTHWYASGITLYLFEAEKNTIINLVGTIVITLFLSFIVVVLVERPVLKVRLKVRKST